MEVEQTTAATTTESQTNVSLAEKAGFDRDTFLKIFLAQLEHQDPLNPQDTSEISAQLAQFSQLEQAMRATDELGDVNSKLDELIEAMGGGNTDRLDPLGMLGKQVDYAGHDIRLTADQYSTALAFDLEEPSDSLSIFVGNDAGAPVARVVLPDSADGALNTLPSGSYFLQFVDGAPRLAGPNGATIDLEFRELSNASTGEIIDYGDAPPFSFFQGQTYSFSGLGVQGQDGVALEFTTTGLVDSIRIEEGRQVLAVNGTSVDPSNVMRIREYIGAGQ